MGDPHVNYQSSAVRKVAFDVFSEALELATSRGIDYIAHTGDFCHMPGDAPNLSTELYETYTELIKSAKPVFVRCPTGNHDIPKSFTEYTTAWELIWRATTSDWNRLQTLPMLTLDFDPRGHAFGDRDTIQEQIEEKIARQPKVDNLLVLAHMHWKGGRDFNTLSKPHNENYLTKKGIRTILDRYGKGVTFVLGHDHTPRDIPEEKCYIIGSPTRFSFGDSAERRFLIYDFEDGSVESVPVQRGLQVQKVGSEIPDLDQKVALDFTEMPAPKLLRELKSKEIKYRVVTPPNTPVGYSTDSFIGGYRAFETRAPVREANLEKLEET